MKKDKRFENAMLILDKLSESGIESSALWIGILCVVAKESELIPKREWSYRNTSVPRLRSLFSGLSDFTDDQIEVMKTKDELFFDIIYGGKLGNRKNTLDGWRYRGGGHNQITGRRWYEFYGLGDRPEQIMDPKVAASVAVKFFEQVIFSNCGTIRRRYDVDPGDVCDTDIAIWIAANANAGMGHGKKSAILQHAFKRASRFKSEMIGFYNEWWGVENMEVE